MDQTPKHTDKSSKKSTGTSVLVVGEPGLLRDSLQAFLTTIPQIETVYLAVDAPSALRAFREQRPALVLMNSGSSSNGIATVLRGIKDEDTKSRCLVLADNKQQQQDALAAGADVALLKGFPAAKLFQIVRRLLLGAPEGKARRK